MFDFIQYRYNFYNNPKRKFLERYKRLAHIWTERKHKSNDFKPYTNGVGFPDRVCDTFSFVGVNPTDNCHTFRLHL